MPIRPPHSDETREQYVFGYCVPLEEEAGYPRDQAMAMCIRYWEESKSYKAYQPRQWSTIDRRKAKYRAKYKKELRKAFGEHVQPVFNKIDQITDIQQMNDQDIERLLDNKPVEKTLKDLYVEAGVFFWMFDLRQAKKRGGYDYHLKQEEEETMEQIAFQEMMRIAEQDIGKNIKIIADTSRTILTRKVREVTRQAIEQGLGAGEAQTLLRDTVSNDWHKVMRYRTERIIRTETTTAANHGSWKGVQSSGIPHLKIWTTSPSESRAWHQEASNQKVDMDEFFTVMGEPMEYPGDMMGSAKNVINCKCCLTYEMKK